MSGRLFGVGAALCALALVGAATAPATSSPAPASSGPRHGGLPLGAADLSETRTARTLQPGVTLTRIVRGADAPAMAWTVEVSIPGGVGSPDPDAPPTALKDAASAAELASGLRADGFDARSEKVTTAATADYVGGTLGWRVRVGTFTTEVAATAERTRLRAAGYTGSAWYTGWDGDAGDRGPWRVDVLTIDPKKFHGDLKASYGPDLENRETTSALAAAEGATAGVNAGFFVLDPKAGAPGDPAGVGVYNGRLLSEAVNGRPGLVVHDSARGTEVERLTWRGSVRVGGAKLPLDGIDRVPGLIRNCGGTADDSPTARPLHDTTCTDPDELVAFTPEFGKQTPKGDGAEAVLDRAGRVVEVRSSRGGALPAGGRSVQATGAYAAQLTALARIGQPLRIQGGLKDTKGRPFTASRSTSILNGGPELVRDGRLHVTPATDGMVQPDNPSFYYGWVHKRNPRTLAGTDAAGRTVLVTADGRGTGSLGLSINESADVAKSLGLRDAINLDGGGSTTMVVDDQVINDPSDATGERPVGDALLVLPATH
ncbi:phosphodiester glycosidase family protein [Streptomyces sp. NBC_00006]|uniref:phosphodiester glycosidase family protein n=1 Tax=Streptomyces sp. NBC_00006 TaxID=2975619 RepID=UPI00224F8E46|nr:phosphodiester glycosidase family protein [Streptomyces sp. NBC_00006]MCX5536117.1 phosphodiester glycosidase family protein [Streptomyces sp. NBC_00006]